VVASAVSNSEHMGDEGELYESEESDVCSASADNSSDGEKCDEEVDTELADIDAQLADRCSMLRDLEAQQDTLTRRLDASMRNAQQFLNTVEQLEARIVEVANEASAPHHTPRTGRGTRLLDNLVGKWSKASLDWAEPSSQQDAESPREEASTSFAAIRETPSVELLAWGPRSEPLPSEAAAPSPLPQESSSVAPVPMDDLARMRMRARQAMGLGEG